jgi:hypothetical protein
MAILILKHNIYFTTHNIYKSNGSNHPNKNFLWQPGCSSTHVAINLMMCGLNIVHSSTLSTICLFPIHLSFIFQVTSVFQDYLSICCTHFHFLCSYSMFTLTVLCVRDYQLHRVDAASIYSLSPLLQAVCADGCWEEICRLKCTSHKPPRGWARRS